MDNRLYIDRYVILFVPWLLAVLFKDSDILSYLISWLGSFVIFYLSMKGKIKPLPDDRSPAAQLMRPIFLVQIIFAGYMCCTSIFYWFDVLGYVDLKSPDEFFLPNAEQLKLTAQCQRYYCLAHASFVCGILSVMRYPMERRYVYDPAGFSTLVFRIALITFVLSYSLNFISGLSQFSHQFNTLSFTAGTLALAMAIPERNTWNTLAAALLYAFNFYHALLSGFKEPIILSVLILGVFLYPDYKRRVSMIFIPLLFLLFLLLPTYNRIFREQAWSGRVSAGQATAMALNGTFSNGQNQSNRDFLSYRLSEIDMFTKYVKSTPAQVDYYGTQLIRQSLMAIIPRVLWPSKPVTETMVMERVYKAGAVSRESNVSAKPPFIVDAFLSGGGIGIFISLFVYGAICQLIAFKAEDLFGGYMLGTALVFTGLFQVFWRGQNFEFLMNTVFWSYITMYVVFWGLRFTNILQKC